MSVSVQNAKRIARRVPEDIATGRQIDLVDEVFAEGCVEHTTFSGDVTGREAVKEQLRGVLEAVPDFRATVESIVAEDDLVAMRVTLSGTHEGTLMGVEPTGERFEVQNAVFTRIEDGKIAERWVLPDTLGMFSQLGVVETPLG